MLKGTTYTTGPVHSLGFTFGDTGPVSLYDWVQEHLAAGTLDVGLYAVENQGLATEGTYSLMFFDGKTLREVALKV